MCCNLRKTERYKLCIHSCCCIQSKYHATFVAQKHIRWNTQKKKGSATSKKSACIAVCEHISSVHRPPRANLHQQFKQLKFANVAMWPYGCAYKCATSNGFCFCNNNNGIQFAKWCAMHIGGGHFFSFSNNLVIFFLGVWN